MMDIYVMGKWEEHQRIKDIMIKLENAGHRITCDWTNHNYEDKGYPVQYAIDDITGVVRADLVIGIFTSNYNYRGALVELGAALAFDKRVIVVGHAIDSCMFSNHPLITHLNTVDELWEVI